MAEPVRRSPSLIRSPHPHGREAWGGRLLRRPLRLTENLLPLDGVAAELRVLVPDFQCLLIFWAIIPLLYRLHALPDLDCHPLGRCAFDSVDRLRASPAFTADQEKAGTGAPNTGLSLRGELRPVLVRVCHVDLVDQVHHRLRLSMKSCTATAPIPMPVSIDNATVM